MAPFHKARAMLCPFLVLLYFDGDALDAKAERRSAHDERSTSVALVEGPLSGKLATVGSASRQIAPMHIVRANEHASRRKETGPLSPIAPRLCIGPVLISASDLGLSAVRAGLTCACCGRFRGPVWTCQRKRRLRSRQPAAP